MPLYDFLDYVHQFGVVSFLLSFLPLVPPSGSSFNTRSVSTLTSGPVLLQMMRGVAGLCKIYKSAKSYIFKFSDGWLVSLVFGHCLLHIMC